MTTYLQTVPGSPARPLSTLGAVRVILGAQLAAARNAHLRSRHQQIIAVILGLLLLAVAGGAYWLMERTTSYLNGPAFARLLAEAAARQPSAGLPADIAPFVQAVPAALLLALLTLLTLSSFSTVLSALFLSGDLDTLVVAPVPMRAVFIVTFFGSLRHAYLLMLVLLLPALVGYGQGMGVGPAFFVAVGPALLLFPLLPAGLAAALVLAVVRVIPARRARDIVAALGGLVGVLGYVVGQLVRPAAQVAAPVQSFSALTALNHPLLPSTWAARALLAAGAGDWTALLGYGGLFAGLALLVFGGCLLLAERLYYAGWANLAAQGGRVRSRRAAERSQRSESWPSLLPPQIWAVLRKDLRVFPRDLRNLQHLIFPLVMCAFWTVQMLADPSEGAATPTLVRTGAPLLISLYLCGMLSFALGGAGIGREGPGLWMLRTAPLSPLQLLQAKWLLAYLPFPLLGPVSVVGLSLLRGDGLAPALGDAALLLSAAVGITALFTASGAAFVRLGGGPADNRVSPLAGLLTLLCALLYGGLVMACVRGLPAFATYLPQFTVALHLAGWLLHGAITALVCWAALAFGARRLSQREL